MNSIGEVVGILNDEYLVVRTQTDVKPNQELVVFEDITDDRLRSMGLSKLSVPKGRVVVVARQEGDLVLVGTTTFKTTRRNVLRSPAAAALLRFGAWMGEHEQVTETIPEEFQAAVKQADSLGMIINREVAIGDYIALGTDR